MVNYKATAAIYLDIRRPGKRKNIFPVKIRVTHRRRQKYYATGIQLKAVEFEKVLAVNTRLTGNLSTSRKGIFNQFNKALDIIDDLKIFSFPQFEKRLLEDPIGDIGSVNRAIKDYIDFLYLEERASSGESYEMTLHHLASYRRTVYFEDITADFLKSWEKFMQKKMSLGTIGLNMRNLRRIYNVEIQRRPSLLQLYPFRGYSIPTNENPKLALTAIEIQLIFEYQPETESELNALDYWKFLYLGNGMNLKDMLFLKWSNVGEFEITFIRAKTKRVLKYPKLIRVPRTDLLNDIVSRQGIRSLNPQEYVFPFINPLYTAKQHREQIRGKAGRIKHQMKKIAYKLGIKVPVNIQAARHTFATMQRNNGAGVGFISEALGHSDIKVTQRYLDNFDEKKRAEMAQNLTPWVDAL